MNTTAARLAASLTTDQIVVLLTIEDFPNCVEEVLDDELCDEGITTALIILLDSLQLHDLLIATPIIDDGDVLDYTYTVSPLGSLVIAAADAAAVADADQ